MPAGCLRCSSENRLLLVVSIAGSCAAVFTGAVSHSLCVLPGARDGTQGFMPAKHALRLWMASPVHYTVFWFSTLTYWGPCSICADFKSSGKRWLLHFSNILKIFIEILVPSWVLDLFCAFDKFPFSVEYKFS